MASLKVETKCLIQNDAYSYTLRKKITKLIYREKII